MANCDVGKAAIEVGKILKQMMRKDPSGHIVGAQRKVAEDLLRPYTSVKKPVAEKLLGTPIPRRLWYSSKREDTGNGKQSTKRKAGRPRYCRDVLGRSWAKHSYYSPSSEKRVLKGGSKKKFALEVCKDLGVSIATAYRGCPPTVVIGSKMTDVCHYCEDLRLLRASISGMAVDCSQRDARKHPLVMAQQEEEKTEQLRSLEWHEQVADRQKLMLEKDVGTASSNKIVCLVDYSSSLQVTPYRGTNVDFRNPLTVEAFGAVIYDGQPTPFKATVFSHKVPKSAYHAKEHLKAALQMYFSARPSSRRKGRTSLEIWCDSASNFRSREFAALSAELSHYATFVGINYHCEYHGKSAADQHFSVLKKKPVKNTLR